MKSSSYQVLAEKCKDEGIRNVYEIIWGRAQEQWATADASEAITHTAADLRDIRDLLFAEVERRHVEDGIDTISMGGLRRQIAERFTKSVVRMTRDGFFNQMTGIGTSMDPSYYSRGYVPVSISPEEGSAYYASGGIASVIIDKKAKGVMLNGYKFEGNGFSENECKKMKDHAEKKGFARGSSDSLRDALTFGGAILYAHLVDDTPLTYDMTIRELVACGVLKKGSIDRFVETDRWNCVFVPRWDVTADDYMTPSSYYIPIGGIKVATDRSAIVRPKTLPFWAAIRQIGWGISDMVGWIPSMLGYELSIQTLPTLFQQMSLLFQRIPLDGMAAQSGIDAVEALIKENEKKMLEWSAAKPKAIGMAGELDVVNRTYTDLDKIIIMQRQDLGAKSGIPESVLFPSQPTGMASDREQDVQLKQSETVKRTQIDVAPAFQSQAMIIAISTFGSDYVLESGIPIMDALDNLEISFDTPAVQTPKDRADALGKFTEGVSKLVLAQAPLDVAVDMALEFMQDIKFPAALMARISREATELSEEEGYEPLEAIERVSAKLEALAGNHDERKAMQVLQSRLADLKNIGRK